MISVSFGMSSNSSSNMRRSIQLASVSLYFFETGPGGPELEDQQVEKKYKAAQTKTTKLLRRTCKSFFAEVIMAYD